MKRGDLVVVQGGNIGTTHWLYGGDEQCWDDRNSLIPTDIPFGFSDCGLVLKKKKMYTQSYVKILTPRGIGWVFENWIKVIQ
jgi:hypothetical protein